MTGESQGTEAGMSGAGWRRFGVVSLFILLNGIVIAAIAFVMLSHQASGQRQAEARKLARETVRLADQSLSEVEKTLRVLGHFYATMEGVEASGGAVLARGAQELLAGGVQFDDLFWATQRGVYHRGAFSATPAAGWPGYQELYRETYNLDHNQTGWLGALPWPAFRNGSGDQETRPVGFVLKVREAGGGTGILMAVTTPRRLFSGIAALPRADISRLVIRDYDTGEAVLDIGTTESAATPVSHTLRIGSKMWEAQVHVPPTPLTLALSALSWAVPGLVLLLTLIAAFVAERKHGQDLRLAEMSKTLEGAHHALQTKTSERDRLFHALRKSEREYRAVINSVSDVIFETDETGRVTFLNETWKRVTDCETQEFTGKSLFDAFPAAERPEQQTRFDALVRGERQAYRTETELDLGHGRVRAVEVAFSMLRMTEDRGLRVVGTITDIEKRRRAEKALREAEQRFRAMFENAISGIYQTSPEGRFVSANPALAEILGYDSADDLTMSVSDIARQVYVDPADRESFVRKLLFEGRVSGVEAQVRRKDGAKIWIMENARVVRASGGGVLYYEGSLSDVTERRAAEEAMRDARLQAEIASRSRMEFLANMSHELRTPLNAVIGFSEIIKGEALGPLGVPAYREYAQDIYDSGNHLLKVISEILEVSKFETGNRELTEGAFAVHRAMRSCMTIMGARIEQSGVEVRVDLPPDLPDINAEELGFKQVMLNLVGNAVKFTDRGGRVAVSARVAESGEMVLSVSDTGIGMTPEEIRKAMQPFGKVDNNFSTMKEGTGLGLTIVESLVRLHGGRFEIESEKGRGTTARVILPARRVLRAGNVTPFRAAQ